MKEHTISLGRGVCLFVAVGEGFGGGWVAAILTAHWRRRGYRRDEVVGGCLGSCGLAGVAGPEPPRASARFR